MNGEPGMIALVPGPEEEPGPVPLAEPLPSIDVLVPLRDEWQALRPCLESLAAFTPWPDLRLTLLDDASDAFTQARLDDFASRAKSMAVRVLRSETRLGFVRNANRGLVESNGELAVLLNSDTLLTPGWLPRLVAALDDARVAAAMPMSNEASFHSLDVPMGWNVFQYAAALARCGGRPFDAVTASGFCLLLRRTALADVGLFDEGYGLGYGEESDWCMRARERGWKVVGVPTAFVHHRGRVTFKDHKQRTFREHNYGLFMSRWAEPYRRAMAAYHAEDALGPLREGFVRMTPSRQPELLRAFASRRRSGGVSHAIAETWRYLRDQGGLRRLAPLVRARRLVRKPKPAPPPMPRGFVSKRRPRVTYVLEKFSLSGGVLSVVQLVNRLQLLGWDAKIATHHDHRQEHLAAYTLYHKPWVFPSAEEMIRHFPESDVVVATLWSTAPKVHRIVTETIPGAVPWYFVQDDETRFFPSFDRSARQAVLDGYPLIENRIVKSEWLAGVLASRGFASERVPLGLDLDAFYVERPGAPRRPRVVAMARPSTPRRGFGALVEVLREVARRRTDVEIALFGCADLAAHGLDFPHVDLGVVPNERLRAVYNEAQVFLDTSEFQGFGRPALEAMACGCATVLGREGGVREYARDGENSLLIDPADRAAAVAAVLRLLDDDALRASVVAAASATVQRFSCDVEARATSRLFAASIGLDERNLAHGRAGNAASVAHGITR